VKLNIKILLLWLAVVGLVILALFVKRATAWEENLRWRMDAQVETADFTIVACQTIWTGALTRNTEQVYRYRLQLSSPIAEVRIVGHNDFGLGVWSQPRLYPNPSTMKFQEYLDWGQRQK